MNVAELVDKANKAKDIKESFELKLGGAPTKMSIAVSDILTMISREQERTYDTELAKCCMEGMQDLPINEDKWKKEFELLEDEDAIKAFKDNKPKNLAEQTAQRASKIAMIQTLLPKVIRDGISGDLLFKSFKEQEAFGRYLLMNEDQMKIVIEKWGAVMNKYSEVRQAAKNLQKGATGQSSAPNANLPDGAMKVHSTPN